MDLQTCSKFFLAGLSSSCLVVCLFLSGCLLKETSGLRSGNSAEAPLIGGCNQPPPDDPWYVDQTPKFDPHAVSCIRDNLRHVRLLSSDQIAGTFGEVRENDIVFANLHERRTADGEDLFFLSRFRPDDVAALLVQKQKYVKPFRRRSLDNSLRKMLTFRNPLTGESMQFPKGFLSSLLFPVQGLSRFDLVKPSADAKEWESMTLTFYHSQLMIELKTPPEVCLQSKSEICSQAKEPGPTRIVLAVYPSMLESEQGMDFGKSLLGKYSAVRVAKSFDAWGDAFFKGAHIEQWRVKDKEASLRIIRQFLEDADNYGLTQTYNIAGKDCNNHLLRTVRHAGFRTSNFIEACQLGLSEITTDGFDVQANFESLGLELVPEEWIQRDAWDAQRKREKQ